MSDVLHFLVGVLDEMDLDASLWRNGDRVMIRTSISPVWRLNPGIQRAISLGWQAEERPAEVAAAARGRVCSAASGPPLGAGCSHGAEAADVEE